MFFPRPLLQTFFSTAVFLFGFLPALLGSLAGFLVLLPLFGGLVLGRREVVVFNGTAEITSRVFTHQRGAGRHHPLNKVKLLEDVILRVSVG